MRRLPSPHAPPPSHHESGQAAQRRDSHCPAAIAPATAAPAHPAPPSAPDARPHTAASCAANAAPRSPGAQEAAPESAPTHPAQSPQSHHSRTASSAPPPRHQRTPAAAVPPEARGAETSDPQRCTPANGFPIPEAPENRIQVGWKIYSRPEIQTPPLQPSWHPSPSTPPLAHLSVEAASGPRRSEPPKAPHQTAPNPTLDYGPSPPANPCRPAR